MSESTPVSPASGSATELKLLPTRHGLKFRQGDFSTLVEALDYAAMADTGLCFFDGKGQLATTLSYRDLRERALLQARRMLAFGLERQARVALIAESEADFIVSFCACQYAGLIPVPAPITIHLGGREAFVGHLTRLVQGSKARLCLATEQYASFIDEARLTVDFAGTYTAFAAELRAEYTKPLVPSRRDEVAYVQYTSGSTRMPRGAVMTEAAVSANILGMLRDGVKLSEEDRFCSWLPLYHDMGLVGMFLAALAGQVTVDYLDSRVFAMRPRLWPSLISRNGATLSYSPPFGYELCARRIRADEAANLNLRQWRVAGVGAEMVRPEVLRRFAQAFAPSGFSPRAFLPCYGMAEVGLGISFSSLNEPLKTDQVDRDRCANEGIAEPPKVGAPPREFTVCGRPIPALAVEIRGPKGEILGPRRVGEIFVRGECVMSGYLDEPEASAEVLKDSWLDTGDLGYWLGEELVITGRRKDLIIVNGRNIWPQDLEQIAESAGVRTGSAAAFAIDDEEAERVIIVIECKSLDDDSVDQLSRAIRSQVRSEFGVDCTVIAVTAKSLPRTSSGKLSRARAQRLFLDGELQTGA